MEPQIHYAKTKDGASIAYCTLGEGAPLVLMAERPASHLQLYWQTPDLRRWWERLAETRKLVCYDGRGSGLSDRDAIDFSIEAQILDLDAVANRLDLARFGLYCHINSTPAGIVYAARNPERVSRLILWCGWAQPSDWIHSPRFRALGGLVFRDWETYTETWMHIAHGWSEAELARRAAALMRESITQQAAEEWARAVRRLNAADYLQQVRSPTLVLHRRQVDVPSVDIARHLASRIPDARLVLLEGTKISPSLDDTDAVVSAIAEFLGEAEEVQTPTAAPSGFVSILFTDIEASASLTERLGDAKARDVLRTHERLVREALRSHGGSEVKTMGDGFMASFSSATKALECAIAMQRSFEEHNESAEEPIRVRVGLNAGEPIAEEEDLFGTAVIVAARIAAKADGGEIIASDVVRQLVAGKGFLFSDCGDTALRGFEDPVRLFEVRWREGG